MKWIAVIIIAIFLISCSSGPAQTPEEFEAQERENVQSGFDDFMKEKGNDDAMAEQNMNTDASKHQAAELPQEKVTKLDVELPSNLKSKYPKLESCFEGKGSVEKVAALASWCVSNLAAENADKQLCTLLVNQEADKCYQAVAKEAKDPSLCEKINSPEIKSSCLAVLS